MRNTTMAEIEVLERFQGLQELNEREQEFLGLGVVPNYIFFDKKNDTAYCTACKTDMQYDEVKGIRQGQEFTCPHCGRTVKGKSLNRKNNFSSEGIGVIMQRLGDDIIFRHYYVGRSYHNENYKKPFEIIEERVRDVYPAYKPYVADFAEIYDYNNRWRRVYQNYSTYYCGMHWGLHVNIDKEFVNLYAENIGQVLQGTRYEHCELLAFKEQVLDKVPNRQHCWIYGNYLTEYGKSPIFEFLLKMGMPNFARELYKNICGYSTVKLDKSQTTVQGILKINKDQLRILREQESPDIKIDLLKYMQAGYGLEEYNTYGKLMPVDEYDNLKKVYHFSFNQFAKYRQRHIDEHLQFNIRDYIDYLNMCVKLGRDMRNTFVVFPKNGLQKAHDAAVEELNKEKVAIQEGNYKKIRAALEKNFSYSGKAFCVVVPMTTKSISSEGQSLHHCVGTYIDRVCEGKTAILFVRKKGQVDKSFYTMEVRNGKLIQCRGMNNRDMTNDVKRFVKAFCTKKQIQMAA